MPLLASACRRNSLSTDSGLQRCRAATVTHLGSTVPKKHQTRRIFQDGAVLRLLASWLTAPNTTHKKKSLQINKNDKVLCHKGTCTIYVNMHYVDRLSEAFTSLGLKIPKTNILELRGEFLLQPQRQNTKWSVAMEDLSWVSSPWHLAHSS